MKFRFCGQAYDEVEIGALFSTLSNASERTASRLVVISIRQRFVPSEVMIVVGWALDVDPGFFYAFRDILRNEDYPMPRAPLLSKMARYFVNIARKTMFLYNQAPEAT